MTSVHLKWIAEYHGPNCHAGTAVVVGELTGDILADTARMDRSLHQGSEPADQDGLFTLARAASDWARSALNEVSGFVQVDLKDRSISALFSLQWEFGGC